LASHADRVIISADGPTISADADDVAGEVGSEGRW
jgi:hypothetical protein